MMRDVCISFCLLLILAGDGIGTTNAQTASSFGVCQTPKKEEGTCVYLKTCDSLYTILQKGSVTDEERALLQSSQCGYHDDRFLVCCPNEEPVAEGSSSNANILPVIPNCAYQLKERTLEGRETELTDFPWLALIEYEQPDNTKGLYCGGALINSRYVLTAAHCVKGRIPANWIPKRVRLGEFNTKTVPDCLYDDDGNKDCAPNHIDVEIEEVTPHPHYVPPMSFSRNQHHDIALLRLAQPVQMSTYISPICLPKESSLQDSTFSEQILTTAGWGATKTTIGDYKEITNLTVVEHQKCRAKYVAEKILVGGGQICASGQSGDSCIVDSGGSLVYTHKVDRPYYILAGINSFGPRTCGQAEWPDVYTRVGQYIYWIEANMKP